MPNFLFLDTETHSLPTVDLTKVGAYKYHSDPGTFNTLVQYAFDDDPVKVWRPGDIIPLDVSDHINAGGYVVAHNAAFDRLHWQYVLEGEYDWPRLANTQVLDNVAQAQAHALPAGLAHLSRLLRLKHQKKAPRSAVYPAKTIVKAYLYEAPTDPRDVATMEQYGVYDVLAMREIWQGTRVLSHEEWHTYHQSEAINDRGVPVDVPLANLCRDAGAKLARICEVEFRRLTGLGVDQTQAIAAWIDTELAGTDARMLMVEAVVEGEDVVEKIRIDADHRTKALACSDIKPHVRDALRVLDIAKVSTTKKYGKVGELEIDGRVHGAYVYNGAGQTGRFSSRNLQMHNMFRGCFSEDEVPAARERIHDFMYEWGTDYAGIAKNHPTITSDLKAMIRPIIAAPEGRLLTWGDWSGIEARLCPWMADSKSSQRVLDLFNAGEDPYVHDAAAVFNVTPEQVTKEQRQMGKVVHLALQFGGGVGALFNMAAGYGIELDMEEAKQMVEAWRRDNPWVRSYADQLWDAAMRAANAPGIPVKAGRVTYYFDDNLLGGSLLCILPCGRPITYPGARFKTETDEARDWTRVVLRVKTGILWAGSLVNHVTQGTAASVLRAAIDDDDLGLAVAHTHDELIIETGESDADFAQDYLGKLMGNLPMWLEGLSIPVDIDSGRRYGK